MNRRTFEAYHPRALSALGIWDIAPVRFKVYGLLAAGKTLTDSMLSKGQGFVQLDVLPLVAQEGDDNGLGFVILHPGDLGLSISAHWWVQGSVLCQHIHRQLYGAQQAMDQRTRPVIACVWELAVINAEQEAWRDTMMGREPNADAYLNRWADRVAV